MFGTHKADDKLNDRFKSDLCIIAQLQAIEKKKGKTIYQSLTKSRSTIGGGLGNKHLRSTIELISECIEFST